jgi:predicted HTH transcriptional regulator
MPDGRSCSKSFQIRWPSPAQVYHQLPSLSLTFAGQVSALLVAGEKLTSRRCEEEFGITRDTAARDFGLLMELGVAIRQGSGRSTSYVLAVKA